MPAVFYDPTNDEGAKARRMACDAALADLMDYIKQDGVRVAAFDATNSTKERRQHITNVLKSAGVGAKRMFVESVCNQEEVSDSLLSSGELYDAMQLAYIILSSFISCWKKIFERSSLVHPIIVIWIHSRLWMISAVVVVSAKSRQCSVCNGKRELILCRRFSFYQKTTRVSTSLLMNRMDRTSR